MASTAREWAAKRKERTMTQQTRPDGAEQVREMVREGYTRVA